MKKFLKMCLWVVRHDDHAHVTVTRTQISVFTGKKWCRTWGCQIQLNSTITDQQLIDLCTGGNP